MRDDSAARTRAACPVNAFRADDRVRFTGKHRKEKRSQRNDENCLHEIKPSVIAVELLGADRRRAGHWPLTGEKSLEDQVRTGEFDPDQLETLMVAAFTLLGKPEVQAQELARAILKAAEQPQSGDPEPPDRDPT
jgi:hypothetical protein